MLPNFLSQSYPMEKNFLLIAKFALRVLGFYPENEKTKLVQAWACFNYVLLIYGSFAEFEYGIQYLSINRMRSLDAFCPVASSIMAIFKVGYIWWYRVEIGRLSKRVAELIGELNSAQLVACKRSYFALATRLSMLVCFFGTFTVNFYTIRAGIVNYRSYWRGEIIPYELPFKMIFPQSLIDMPIFPLTFTLTHWHGYITVLACTGVDSLFICFCLYFVILLKALQYDLTDILVDGGYEKIKQHAETDVEESLKKVIARHNEIIELINRFSAVMAGLILGHFVTSSFIIGAGIVNLLLFSDYGVFIYMPHTFGVSSELFLYCFGGTAIIESSSELATKAYCSYWYTHSVSVQKMVLLIIVRAQRSLAVKVPFFAPSLPTLTSLTLMPCYILQKKNLCNS